MDDEKELQGFEGMSFKEIKKLSPAAFERRMKFEQAAASVGIGDPKYKSYTEEEKIHFWIYQLNRQMRIQIEGGLDPYAVFTPHWYSTVKKEEPGIDAFMDKVFASPVFQEWDKEKYVKGISGS